MNERSRPNGPAPKTFGGVNPKGKRGGRPKRDPAPGSFGTCRRCGKRLYATRKLARKAARQMHHDSTLNAYQCGDGWHIGHLPAYVKRGDFDRSELRTGRRVSA